jgi:hypothetical protein
VKAAARGRFVADGGSASSSSGLACGGEKL